MITYAFQWFHATVEAGVVVEDEGLWVGSDIAGATSNTYTQLPADEGQRLYCEVTATNAFGSAMAQSNVSPAVTEP